MEKNESPYVIDDIYTFDVVADGCRPSSAGSVNMRVSLTHDDAMEMARYFYREEPYAINYDEDFGLVDSLNELYVEQVEDDLREEWEEEQDERREEEGDEYEESEEPDFNSQAWECMSEMYFCWSGQLMEDCIEYCKKHIDCDIEDYDWDEEDDDDWDWDDDEEEDEEIEEEEE